MTTLPHAAPTQALTADASVAALPTAACPIAAAVKARAKALKKWRKQERLRFFSGCCASFHALGFCF